MGGGRPGSHRPCLGSNLLRGEAFDGPAGTEIAILVEIVGCQHLQLSVERIVVFTGLGLGLEKRLDAICQIAGLAGTS